MLSLRQTYNRCKICIPPAHRKQEVEANNRLRKWKQNFKWVYHKHQPISAENLELHSATHLQCYQTFIWSCKEAEDEGWKKDAVVFHRTGKKPEIRRVWGGEI